MLDKIKVLWYISIITQIWKGTGMAVKEKKATASDSNYVLKSMNEFTMMNSEELKNWAEIQKALKEGRLKLCF